MTDRVKSVIFDDEIMQGLFQAGFISATVFSYREIYLWVDAQMKVRKVSKYRAMNDAANKFNLHFNTIDKACKKFK